MRHQFSSIIQGCMTWGQWGKNLSKQEMIALLHQNLHHKITTFDHADIYGDYTTEKDFGIAFSESGIKRENIEIISKCGIQYVGKTRKNPIKHYQYDAKYIIWSAENSIKNLKCDYLDLFLLHRPSPLMHPEEIEKAITQLISQGKIKHFGVSNFTPSQMELVGLNNPIKFNQIEFSLTAHQAMLDGTLDYLLINKITPMCWSPLGNYFKENSNQNQRIKEVLKQLTQKYNCTDDALLLAWILKHPTQILPVIGTTSPERIKNSVKATTINLEEVDWFALWVASQGQKVP